MPNPKCEACQKTAYPLESVTALEKTYHKSCFKCEVCKTTLNLKNFKGYEGKIYCLTHTPKPKATTVTDTVAMKSALNAPKKVAEGLSTAHRGARELQPQSSGDFTVNNASVDQSTENNPEESHVQYEARGGDQSTENTPSTSDIVYEPRGGDQSIDPDAGGEYAQQYEEQPQQYEEQQYTEAQE